MPNDYSGIKQVRNTNNQRFVDDFKRLPEIVVVLPSGLFFQVKKADVWRAARYTRIVYSIYNDLYERKRDVLAITGGYIPIK